MGQNSDYELYFNIIFFGAIGFGFLVGYFRGLRKTIRAFMISFIFYALFFITIDFVINQVWTIPMPGILSSLGGYIPEIGGTTTIKDAIFTLIETRGGAYLSSTLTNEYFIDLTTGISQFALKLVYTLLYFTIGFILYHIIVAIVLMIFFSGHDRKVKKAKKQAKKQKRQMKKMKRKDRLQAEKSLNKYKKKHVLGAFAGALKGGLSAFITLIILGGMLNISDSMLSLFPEETTTTATDQSIAFLATNTSNAQPLASGVEVPESLQPQLAEARRMLSAFQENTFVKTASSLVIKDKYYTDKVPLHLYLFDTVLSFKYRGDKVRLRNEINVMSESAGIFLNSEFSQTNKLNDIDPVELETVFNKLSRSNLFTSMLPVGIAAASDYFDAEIGLSEEELYAIDWQSELQSIGSILAVGVELVQNAGITTPDSDLETITLDGNDVKNLFESFSESELAQLAATVGLEPYLENNEGTISTIITVPAGLNWEEEFLAFGEVSKAIFDTNISIGDLQAGDPTTLISALSSLDFTVLLESQIMSHALKNIFSKEAAIDGLDMLVVPNDVMWFDQLDTNGNITENGELRNILLAFNAISSISSTFDFNNLSFDILSEFDEETIDTMFNSQILVASISNYIMTMDLGNTPLLIPDSVLDENNYILASELKAVAKSASVLVNDLQCDEGDTTCEAQGFDISKAFSLTDTSIDTLTSSDILGATIGNLVIDQAGTILVIPDSSKTTISVNSIDQAVVSNEAIKYLFKAVGVLGFTDLETLNFDISIIQSLGLESDPTTLDITKSNTLFTSKIVHATLSKMLFDQESTVLSIPEFDIDGTVIRNYDASDNLEYITETELEDTLQALLKLDLASFSNIDGLDLSVLITNSSDILESSILHATISEELLTLGTDVLIIPNYSQLGETTGNEIRKTVGSFEYVIKDEIDALFNAFSAMGFSDLNTFGTSIDSSTFFTERSTLLTSSSIQATVSDKLLNDSGGALLIPDENVGTSEAIRINQTDVTYIELSELNNLLDSLDLLGLTDFSTFDFSPATIFSADAATLLESASMQATISVNVLDFSVDETAAYGTTSLVVPTHFREEFTEASVVKSQIEKQELIDLINSLDLLGITDYSLAIDDAIISNMSETELSTLLTSASMHTTIDNMMRGNVNISAEIPVLAETTRAYKTDIILKSEIIGFIMATQVMTTGSFTNASIDITTLASLNATEQDIATSSMIVRNIVTPTLEDVVANDPLNQATISNTDYEEDNPAYFLRKAKVLSLIATYY
ncbi:MAG: hypothetical protein K9L74_03960 [Candidatus Izimaplasma sp.]|nr:hypothetical protein [Candidatus Izimaplasma bacterium]